MGLFKTVATLVAEPNEKYPEHLEVMAKAAEAEALAKNDTLLAEAIAEHERQVAGYHFECKRQGDFLSVFIERNGNPTVRQADYDWYPVPERNYATALNLSCTREIKLVIGNAPDQNGALAYGFDMPDDAGSGARVGGTMFGKYAPHKGAHYEIHPRYPKPPYSRSLFELDPEPQPQQQFQGMYVGDDSYNIKYKTPGYVRIATDDSIRFEGIRATIFAPAGVGQSVYEAVLAAA